MEREVQSDCELGPVASNLRSRGLLETYSGYPYVDEEEGVATFLLYNGNKLVGYQQYRPAADKKKRNHPRDGRYFTYLPKETDGLYGLEQDAGRGTLFVVEGIFKAIKLHNLGYNAISPLGATPKRLKPYFRVLKATRKLVALGDNDPAGASLVRTVGYGRTTPTDLDEMSDEAVRELVKEYL